MYDLMNNLTPCVMINRYILYGVGKLTSISFINIHTQHLLLSSHHELQSNSSLIYGFNDVRVSVLSLQLLCLFYLFFPHTHSLCILLLLLLAYIHYQVVQQFNQCRQCLYLQNVQLMAILRS